MFCWFLFLFNLCSCCFSLLDAAGILLSVLELESRFGTILFEIGQLLGIDGSSSLPESNIRTKLKMNKVIGRNILKRGLSYLLSDQSYRVLVLEAKLDESESNKYGRSTEPGNAMNGHACLGGIAESIFQKLEPFVYHLKFHNFLQLFRFLFLIIITNYKFFLTISN